MCHLLVRKMLPVLYIHSKSGTGHPGINESSSSWDVAAGAPHYPKQGAEGRQERAVARPQGAKAAAKALNPS